MCMNTRARAYTCNIYIICILYLYYMYKHSTIYEIYINLMMILLKIIIKLLY